MPGSVNPPDINELETKGVEDEAAAVEERLEETGVLNAELIASIKKQVTSEIVAELKEDKFKKTKEREILREQEDIEHQRYVATMKESEDPWVEFVGDVRDTRQGQRLQMEWNDAFIDYLKASGIVGADEEQIVQKYISLLMRDMNDKTENRFGSDYE